MLGTIELVGTKNHKALVAVMEELLVSSRKREQRDNEALYYEQ
jgi:hypothetical protein